MSARVTISDHTGTPVARKAPRDDPDRARLEHEAEVLAAVAHPGVVAFVGCDRTGLSTTWVGNHSLATHRPPSLTQGVAVAAAVAATLADLHQSGTTHGGLAPDHVLLAPDGRPVLCSLGQASTGSLPGDPLHEGRAAEDVAAFGHLLDHLLAHSDLDDEDGRARWASRGRRHWPRHLHRVVASLAARARHPDPTRRPGARALATALADLVPDATFALPDHLLPSPSESVDALGLPPPPPRPAPEPAREAGGPSVDPHQDRDDLWEALDRLRPLEEPPPPSPRPARRGLAVGLVVVVLVSAAAASLATAGRSTSASSPSPRPETTPPPASSVVEGVQVPCRTRAPEATDRAAAAGGAASLDIDADGCPETVTVDGQVLAVGNRRFAAGVAGDDLLVGDWDCDGRATPALLRPSSGEVFVFSTWAEPGAAAQAPRVAVIPDGAALIAEPRGEVPPSCSRLAVRRHHGPPVPVALPSTPSQEQP